MGLSTGSSGPCVQGVTAPGAYQGTQDFEDDGQACEDVPQHVPAAPDDGGTPSLLGHRARRRQVK